MRPKKEKEVNRLTKSKIKQHLLALLATLFEWPERD